MRLLIVVNVDWFFLSHRLSIAKAAVEAGWEVHVATSFTDRAGELAGHGFFVHKLDMHRSSSNPLGLLRAFVNLVTLYREVRPRVVHLVTIKPVLLGGVAARLTRVPGVVFAVSGLGHVFTADSTLGRVRRAVVRRLYQIALRHTNKVVIFQNENDKAVITQLGCVSNATSVLLPGSGFDVDSYEVTDIPARPPIFLMASRLLRTKGVMEFASAAKRMGEAGYEGEFWLVGASDSLNPASISEEELNELGEIKNLRLLGHREDVPDLMRLASVVVLPSYYGEGLPKVLIEAAAAGRAVITTDTPGCRDAIVDGSTGLLVKERDIDSLMDAMWQFANDRETLEEFGREGRRRAEAIFRIQDVVAAHLELYSRLARD